MRLSLLFAVASLTLVVAIVVIASPNPVEAKKLYCYSEFITDIQIDICLQKKKDCEAAFLADPNKYLPCSKAG